MFRLCCGLWSVGCDVLTGDPSPLALPRQQSNTDTPLPIRWMPKEAFMGQKFSEASDVWSFGITCCEIFTGGDNPWGTVPNFTVMELIKAGVRHDQPDLCPNMLYDQVLLVRWLRCAVSSVFRPLFEATRACRGVGVLRATPPAIRRAAWCELRSSRRCPVPCAD